MSEQEHTELPWSAERTSVREMWDIKLGTHSLAAVIDNQYIPSKASHDAKFIALACNNHYKLLDALEYARRFLNKEDHDTDYIDKVLSEIKP